MVEMRAFDVDERIDAIFAHLDDILRSQGSSDTKMEKDWVKILLRDYGEAIKPPVLMTLEEVAEANKGVPTPLSEYVYHESKGYLDAISKLEQNIKRELGE